MQFQSFPFFVMTISFLWFLAMVWLLKSFHSKPRHDQKGELTSDDLELFDNNLIEVVRLAKIEHLKESDEKLCEMFRDLIAQSFDKQV